MYDENMYDEIFTRAELFAQHAKHLHQKNEIAAPEYAVIAEKVVQCLIAVAAQEAREGDWHELAEGRIPDRIYPLAERIRDVWQAFDPVLESTVSTPGTGSDSFVPLLDVGADVAKAIRRQVLDENVIFVKDAVYSFTAAAAVAILDHGRNELVVFGEDGGKLVQKVFYIADILGGRYDDEL